MDVSFRRSRRDENVTGAIGVIGRVALELVEGLHPALLGAANAMGEWVEEVPLTRKEKEVRAQARAQAATTSADATAKAAAEAADAASETAKAKAAEERAAAAKAAAELALRNAPTDPGSLASWGAPPVRN